VIDLRRRLPKERISPFRLDRGGHLDVLARMAARWAQDNAERVAAADPVMPDGVINREADNWRPLVAIANVAGGRWPKRACKAALKAHAATVAGDEASLLEMLLGDIRNIFKERDKPDKPCADITSANLVEALVAIEVHPWAELGKERKPLTQHRLAKMLKPLAIVSEKIGPKGKRLGGYVRAHFKDAFERYLEPEGASDSDTRTQRDEMGTSDIFDSDTIATGCPSPECEKPNNDGLVSGCPSAKGGNGQGTHMRGPLCAHCLDRAPHGRGRDIACLSAHHPLLPPAPASVGLASGLASRMTCASGCRRADWSPPCGWLTHGFRNAT